MQYLGDDPNEDQIMEAVKFWGVDGPGRQKYPLLYNVAKRVLSVPASSAPVERIFSRGGLIVRPHRARISDQMLNILMFLKCNDDVV